MWNIVHKFLGNQYGSPNSNATSISIDQLVSLYQSDRERLIVLDLRHVDDVERFPYVIPEALLTTQASLPELVDWIPPQAIVILYGADRISAHADLIASLPQDAHFYLLEGGIKSWRQAKLPVERVDQFTPQEAPNVWKRSSADMDRESTTG